MLLPYRVNQPTAEDLLLSGRSLGAQEATRPVTRLVAEPKQPGRRGARAIFEDSRGSVWVGTYGQGILVLRPGTESWQQIRSDTTRTSMWATPR